MGERLHWLKERAKEMNLGWCCGRNGNDFINMYIVFDYGTQMSGSCLLLVLSLKCCACKPLIVFLPSLVSWFDSCLYSYCTKQQNIVRQLQRICVYRQHTERKSLQSWTIVTKSLMSYRQIAVVWRFSLIYYISRISNAVIFRSISFKIVTFNSLLL